MMIEVKNLTLSAAGRILCPGVSFAVDMISTALLLEVLARHAERDEIENGRVER